MDHIFGRDHYRVIAVIARIADLSPEEAGKVTSAWKRASSADRARAWAGLIRATTEPERYQILAAASLARREALSAAHRMQRHQMQRHQMQRLDWALWAAASDAAAAVAAGPGIGNPYQTLTAPLATVMPSLVMASPAAAPASTASTASTEGTTAADVTVGSRNRSSTP